MKPLIVKIYMGSGMGGGGGGGGGQRGAAPLLPPPLPSSPTDIMSATKEFLRAAY